MGSIGQSVFQNPIIQRLHRHAALPTLFRSASAPPARAPGEQAMVRASAPISQPQAGLIQAQLLPPGHTVGPLPVVRQPSPAAEYPVQRRTIPPPPAELAPAGAPETQPLAPTPSEIEAIDDDGNWQRLQVIHMRHQEMPAEQPPSVPAVSERAMPQTAGPAETPPSAQVQDQRPAPPTKQPASEPAPSEPGPAIKSHPTEGLRPGAVPPGQESVGRPVVHGSGLVQKMAVPEPPALAAPEGATGADSAELEDARMVGTEAEVSASVPAATVRPSTLEQPADLQAEQFVGPATVAARTVVPPEPETPAPAPTRARPVAGVQARREEARPQGTDGPADQGFAPDDHESAEQAIPLSGSAQQSLPLQDVWSVQRLEEDIVSPDTGPVDIPAPVSSPEPETKPARPIGEQASGEPMEPPKTERIHQVLSGATPGQPSDSSIELIPPRRPRPDAPAVPASQPVENPGPGLVEEPRPEHLQAPPSEYTGVESPISLAGSEAAPSEPVKVRPHTEPAEGQNSLQRETEGTPTVQMRGDGALDLAQSWSPDEVRDEPILVRTEIGPLPGDLWHLIGESPPESPPETPPETPPSQPGPVSAGREDAAKRAAEAAEAPPASPSLPGPQPPVVQRSTPTPVQRQPDVAGVETEEPAAIETQTSAQPDEHGTWEEPDVDELAQRVYTEIKRRFSVEWERVRHRG